jgi:hypothetical protein
VYSVTVRGNVTVCTYLSLDEALYTLGSNPFNVIAFPSGVPRDFFRGGGFYQEFFSGGSTNSVEGRGQRERGSGGVSPLVRGSNQLANE